MNCSMIAGAAIVFLSAWPASALSGTETNTAAAYNVAFALGHPIERIAPMNDRAFLQAIAPSQTEPHTRTRAEAKITVHSSEATPYDQTTSPALIEIRLV